jgi:hypothetical protein
MVVSEPSQERAPMEKVSIIGLDLAKSIIQVHAASADKANSETVFQGQKLPASQLLKKRSLKYAYDF